MKLNDLQGVLPAVDKAAGEVVVSGITSDSREVRPGSIFAALSGSKADGAAFARDAAARGAVAILAG
ncbi:MAG: Mur ligase domain-containing protein, partial [Mesorhizobium sp.]